MPQLSPDSDFEKVLAVASDQFKDGKITVRFSPSGKANFTIDDASLRKSLAGSGVEEPTFRRVFDGEIGPLVDAVIRGRVRQFVSSTMIGHADSTVDSKGRAELEAELESRAKTVEASLVTRDLRARYSLKIYSKYPRLRRLTWEVVEKRFEPNSDGPVSHPYATLSLETLQPEKGVGDFFSWFPFSQMEEAAGRADYTTFDADEQEVDDLIQKLEAIRAALSQARSGGKND